MMLPEVRVFFERAGARRQSLLGLVTAIPSAYWLRTAPGDAWSARNHLEHVATADTFLDHIVTTLVDGAEAWLAGTADPRDLLAARAEAMRSFDGVPLDAILEAMTAARTRLAQSLAVLERSHLLAPVFIAGHVSAWGEPRAITFGSYLDAWAAHDSAHESSIRDAVSTPPDLVTVALTRRLR
jgi:hypothetical protein